MTVTGEGMLASGEPGGPGLLGESDGSSLVKSPNLTGKPPRLPLSPRSPRAAGRFLCCWASCADFVIETRIGVASRTPAAGVTTLSATQAAAMDGASGAQRDQDALGAGDSSPGSPSVDFGGAAAPSRDSSGVLQGAETPPSGSEPRDAFAKAEGGAAPRKTSTVGATEAADGESVWSPRPITRVDIVKNVAGRSGQPSQDEKSRATRGGTARGRAAVRGRGRGGVKSRGGRKLRGRRTAGGTGGRAGKAGSATKADKEARGAVSKPRAQSFEETFALAMSALPSTLGGGASSSNPRGASPEVEAVRLQLSELQRTSLQSRRGIAARLGDLKRLFSGVERALKGLGAPPAAGDSKVAEPSSVEEQQPAVASGGDVTDMLGSGSSDAPLSAMRFGGGENGEFDRTLAELQRLLLDDEAMVEPTVRQIAAALGVTPWEGFKGRQRMVSEVRSVAAEAQRWKSKAQALQAASEAERERASRLEEDARARALHVQGQTRLVKEQEGVIRALRARVERAEAKSAADASARASLVAQLSGERRKGQEAVEGYREHQSNSTARVRELERDSERLRDRVAELEASLATARADAAEARDRAGRLDSRLIDCERRLQSTISQSKLSEDALQTVTRAREALELRKQLEIASLEAKLRNTRNAVGKLAGVARSVRSLRTELLTLRKAAGLRNRGSIFHTLSGFLERFAMPVLAGPGGEAARVSGGVRRATGMGAKEVTVVCRLWSRTLKDRGATRGEDPSDMAADINMRLNGVDLESQKELESRLLYQIHSDAVYRTEKGLPDVEASLRPLIDAAAAGRQSTLLLYSGSPSAKSEIVRNTGGVRGETTLVERILASLFARLRELGNFRAKDGLGLEMMQFYNGSFTDLLAPRAGPSRTPPADLAMAVAREPHEATASISRGYARSRESQRSKRASREDIRACSFYVINVSCPRGSGRLTIVDLASPFTKLPSGVTKSAKFVRGHELKEVRTVNHTLFAVSNVLAVMQTPRAHIPFRESRLTLCLRAALQRSTAVTVLACVDLDEPTTIEPTVKFVQHVCRTKTNTRVGPDWRGLRRRVVAEGSGAAFGKKQDQADDDDVEVQEW